MQYILIALVLMVLCGFGLSCRKGTSNPAGGEPNEIVTIFSRRSMSREQIQKQLAQIAAKPAPKNLAMGAMCYYVLPSPARIDYVCPTCGEKTLYAEGMEDSGDQEARLQRQRRAGAVGSLESLRRMAQQITKLDVTLDESQFCRHCYPDITEPKVGLIVRYPDRPEPHRVWGINQMDLTMIKTATEGKLKYKNQHGWEVALKDHLPRLTELFGD